MQFIRELLRREDAATAVEYAVLLALILMAVIGSISLVGEGTGNMWGGIESHVSNAGLGK
jgi:pilus assembly protein Flp/PilA